MNFVVPIMQIPTNLIEVDYFPRAPGEVLNRVSSKRVVLFYGKNYIPDNVKIQDLLKKLESVIDIYVNEFKLICPQLQRGNKISVYFFGTGLQQPVAPGPGVAAYGGNGSLVINSVLDWTTFKDSFHELSHVFCIGGCDYHVCESYATFAANFCLNRFGMKEDYGVDNVNRFLQVHPHQNYAIDATWDYTDMIKCWTRPQYSPYQGWHLHQYIYKTYGLDFVSKVLYYQRTNPKAKFFNSICTLLGVSGADFMAKYVVDFLTLNCCTFKNIMWHYFTNRLTPTVLEWRGYQVFDITTELINKTGTISWTCSPNPENWRIVLITVKPTKPQYSSKIYKVTDQPISLSVVPKNKYWIAFVTGTTDVLVNPPIYSFNIK